MAVAVSLKSVLKCLERAWECADWGGMSSVEIAERLEGLDAVNSNLKVCVDCGSRSLVTPESGGIQLCAGDLYGQILIWQQGIRFYGFDEDAQKCRYDFVGERNLSTEILSVCKIQDKIVLTILTE